MAESLVELEDPLATALIPGRACPVAEVVAAIAASLLPAEANQAPPSWLRADQGVSFRRCLAALERHGGALLADPAGSGKTWIALAIAAACARRTVVLAPASLLPHWREVAARAGVPIELHSHELASRGRLPRGRPELVLVDESHGFRNPLTRRYQAVAGWLARSRVLLLSATPVVNALGDLTHQLLLAVPDDALLAAGCPSLRQALGTGTAPAGLGEVIVCRAEPSALPGLRRRRLQTRLADGEARLLERIARLRLSRDPATRGLLLGGLLGAMASSPAALLAALERYQALLRNAAHAVGAGRRLSRDALRAAVGPDPDQLVLWELLPEGDGFLEIALDDREPVSELLERLRQPAEGEPDRLRQLRALLADGVATLVFSGSTATVEWLRRELGPLHPAWVTGSAAGIGSVRLPRSLVLARFRPGAVTRPGEPIPTILLATDVAAEGLDLHRAGRVVHYDLPWTTVRLVQRAGRARRLGSDWPVVEVVTFLPPPPIERLARRVRRLTAKAGLPGRMGLAEESRWLFRWRSDLAPLAGPPVQGGLAAVRGADPGWLVSLSLVPDHGGSPPPARLLWVAEDGAVTDQPAVVVPRLLAASGATARELSAEDRRMLPEVLAPVVRAALGEVSGGRWKAVDRPREQRRLIYRLLQLTPALAAARDQRALRQVDRALAWLDGGLRAGELLLVARLVGLDDVELPRALPAIGPARRPPAPPLPTIAGIVRVTNFP